jgi:methionyl-tRNA formyltransferase
VRTIFFGTPAFALPSLEALLSSSHPVVGVVTQPDRPRGRGQRTTEGPVKQVAIAHHLPVFQPEKLKDVSFLEELGALGADLGAVVAYGRILPEAVLDVPPQGLINVHASLLPKYRGAAPIERAVVAGERMTGVTIMRVVRELDAGPMLATRTRAIGPDETSDVVARDLAQLGARLLVETIDAMARGDVHETAQDDRLATYASRLQKHEGLIDWSRSAVTIHNQVRGLQPWPLAYTFLNGRRYLILRTDPGSNRLRQDDGGPPKRHAKAEEPGCSTSVTETSAKELPGTIVEAEGDQLRVATGTTPLRILRIQAEGKRPMAPREFLAGHRLSPDDRFTTPSTS